MPGPSPCHPPSLSLCHSHAHTIPKPLPSSSPCQSFTSLYDAHVHPIPKPVTPALCMTMPCHPRPFVHSMPTSSLSIPLPFSRPWHFLPHSHACPVPCPCHVLFVTSPSPCHPSLLTMPKPMSSLPLCHSITPVPLPTPCLSPSPSLHHPNPCHAHKTAPPHTAVTALPPACPRCLLVVPVPHRAHPVPMLPVPIRLPLHPGPGE